MGRDDRVEFAIDQHSRQCLSLRDRLKIDIGWKFDRGAFSQPWLIHAPAAPMDVLRADPEVIGEKTTRPKCRGHLVLRHSNSLPAQVLCRANIAIASDVE